MIQGIKSDIWSLIMLKCVSITIHGTSYREIQKGVSKKSFYTILGGEEADNKATFLVKKVNIEPSVQVWLVGI